MNCSQRAIGSSFALWGDGYSYEYDKQNRISAIKQLDVFGAESEMYSYEYDKLGQLVRYNDKVANKSYTYTYDGNGNILSKSEYDYTTGALGVATDTTTYSYEADWADKLTKVDGQEITYDNIGNPLSYLGATLTWQGRQLTSYSNDEYTSTYEYDENGMRYRTTVLEKGFDEETNQETIQETTYEYVWADGKLVSLVYFIDEAQCTAKYLYNEFDEPVGMVYTDESNYTNTYYYLKNAQGDITCIVDSSGEKIISLSYDAFGKVSAQYHLKNSLSTVLGMVELIVKKTLHRLVPFGYRGYCYDTFTELYYLQSRYYDPNTGRFINADDTNYLNATGTVLGCNLFAYCENDPVNRVDPKGTISFQGDNLFDGTKSALRKFAKNILKKEKEIVIKITKDYKRVHSGKITYRDNLNKKKTLKFVIGNKYKWKSYTSTTLYNNQNFANELGWVVHNEIGNMSEYETPSSFAPLGIVCVAGIALYFGSQKKYDNFIKIYDSVYGEKGLDPYNIRFYFLMRIEGVDKYEGWYAIPDVIGRVIKVR